MLCVMFPTAYSKMYMNTYSICFCYYFSTSLLFLCHLISLSCVFIYFFHSTNFFHSCCDYLRVPGLPSCLNCINIVLLSKRQTGSYPCLRPTAAGALMHISCRTYLQITSVHTGIHLISSQEFNRQ